MYHQYQLKNKTNIYLVPQSDTKSVTVMIMYPVGSRYESEKMRGVSHYVEHLMFKGTKKRPNTLVLTREIDRLGAQYNAFTGKEYTGYYIKADAQYTETALDILSDMLHHSVFDAKEMEREKTVIVEEIKMYNDNPLMNIENIFEEVMYDGCPMGLDIAGTEKHVLGYKRPDVLAYRDRYYQPSNMHVIVAGAVNDKTKQFIETYFGKAKEKQNVSKAFKPAAFGSSKKADRIKIQRKQTDQAQLMLGFPAFSYNDKNNDVLTVLNTILGGSMSSRLFIRIRERLGLAYMIRSAQESYRDIGHSYIRVGLDPKNINKAIAAIQKEIVKLIEKGVTKRELADAKTHIRGGLTLSLENSSSVANWFAEEALFANKIDTPEEHLAAIDAVTQEDVQRIAKKVFVPTKMRVAIIGDVAPEDVTY